MATPFSTSELLKSLSCYPVSKLGGGLNAQSSALTGQANALHTVLENDLSSTVSKHKSIADSHRAIASQLPPGIVKNAHLEAANAHDTAASEINAIMPVTGNSIASNSLTAEKAAQYSSRAANFTEAANQATINQPVSKNVFVDPDLLPDAQNVLNRYNTPVTSPIPDLKSIAGLHWTLAREHNGVADGLDLQASIERANNGGATTEKVRQYSNAASVNRQAAQAHFTAGNAADENAYSTSKVEGGWKPAANASYGGNKKLSENAMEMSRRADEAKQQALA